MQRARHLARDQDDQPGDELDDGERAATDDRQDEPTRDEQEKPEQDREPVQPAGHRHDPDRIVGIGQRERRIHVGEQKHVRVHPRHPAQVSGEEIGREDGQPSGE
jgi:hypothetical protein